MKRYLLPLCIAFALSTTALAQITIPHTFSAGTRAQSAEVNENFSEVGDKACNRTGCTLQGNLVPDGNNTRTLGASGTRFANGYFVLGNFSGDVTGSGYVSAASGFKERSRSVALGEWTACSFSAGDFTASTGTWTVDAGDVAKCGYTLIGKTMHLDLKVSFTDVSATPSQLRFAIPGGFIQSGNPVNVPAWGNDAGGAFGNNFLASASGVRIEITKADIVSNFTATSSDNTSLSLSVTFEVQ